MIGVFPLSASSPLWTFFSQLFPRQVADFKASRVVELEGLRGLLAIMVVGVHLLPVAGLSTANFGPFEPLFGDKIRVKIFCIISGFVIFLMLENSTKSYQTYMFGRIKRIYPAYIVTFLVSLALLYSTQLAHENTPFSTYAIENRAALADAALNNLWPHILSHVTMMHGLLPEAWLPKSAYTILGQAWNLSTEMQFYVVAPLLYWCIAMGPWWKRVTSVMVLAVVCVWAYPLVPSASLPKFAGFFAAGVATYYLWRMDWSGVVWLSWVGTFVLAIGVGQTLAPAFGVWVFIIGSALLVRDKGYKEGAVTRFLKSEPMLNLGVISYAIYLVHMIPMNLAMLALNDAGLGRFTYFGFVGLITLTGTMVLSVLLTRYVEQPVLVKKETKR